MHCSMERETHTEEILRLKSRVRERDRFIDVADEYDNGMNVMIHEENLRKKKY